MTATNGELLALDVERGEVAFAGKRARILDGMAMGPLRNHLLRVFGPRASRVVLTQFGFSHGWRLGKESQSTIGWENASERRHAGVAIEGLEGLVGAGAAKEGPLTREGMTVERSTIAAQHLKLAGVAKEAVCWSICGVMSGYLSRCTNLEIFVLEDRCVGKGDPVCHFLGRTREGWGSERAHDLEVFEAHQLGECTNASLARVTGALTDAHHELSRRGEAPNATILAALKPSGIVAQSPAMRQVVDLVLRVAEVDSTILITGENGSGKERVAQLLHQQSKRAAAPFVAINCGALTETLLESELFGHARGSFTGAIQDRRGLFESADGGTLLLDEIGEISPAMQVKILRVLQERELRRVGETKSRQIDVRVLAATNRDLVRAVACGEFREDLFYRLKVIELRVPALRERQEDLLPLANILLTDAALRMGKVIEGLAPGVAQLLLRYSWPGNVRELGNAMERGCALTEGAWIEADYLPDEVRDVTSLGAVQIGSSRTLADAERAHILKILAANSGNQAETARQLQIGPATLYRKLKQYGMIHHTRVRKKVPEAALPQAQA